MQISACTMTEQLAAAALGALTTTAPPSSYFCKPGQCSFPKPQQHMLASPSMKMFPLLWKPPRVCAVTFKSIWQSARVFFSAPCHKLSESGSLRFLWSGWAAQNVLQLLHVTTKNVFITLFTHVSFIQDGFFNLNSSLCQFSSYFLTSKQCVHWAELKLQFYNFRQGPGRW